MTVDCCVSIDFLRSRVDRKHLIRFQSEASVFRFLRRIVDGAWITQVRRNRNSGNSRTSSSFPEIPNLRSYLPSLPTISLQDRKFRKNSVIFVFGNLRKFKPEFLSFIIILIPFLRDIVECRCLFLPEQSAGCNKDKLQYQKIYQVPWEDIHT